jgi:hypothetical protein
VARAACGRSTRICIDARIEEVADDAGDSLGDVFVYVAREAVAKVRRVARAVDEAQRADPAFCLIIS